MTYSVRVAMIIQGYHPRIGGAERQLATVAPLLQARGIDVQVVTRRYPGLAPFEMINGIPVHRMPIPGPRPVKSLSYTLTSLALLRRLRPDVIHAYELSSPTTTGVVARRLFGTPLVVKLLRGGIKGDIHRLHEKIFGAQRLRMFVQNVDAYMTISQEIDRELAEAGVSAERRPFIPNGVDIDRFAPVSLHEKLELRAKLGLPDGLIAVFTGRLAPEKRVDQLISIWPAVRALHPDALLLLLGTGEQEPALKQMAGEGVRFNGRTEDIAPYLKAADLFILPSATEGLSNALLEGMAAALPAIATNVGGAPDLIEHGSNGWLIPPDTPDALQAAVLRLLGDAELRAHLGQQGRARVMRDYALPVVADRLAMLYQRLARNRRVAPGLIEG